MSLLQKTKDNQSLMEEKRAEEKAKRLQVRNELKLKYEVSHIFSYFNYLISYIVHDHV